MNIEDLILASIGLKGADFGAFCSGLKKRGICPREGDKAAWRNVFNIVRKLRNAGMLETTEGETQNIENLTLTAKGAERARILLDADRGLLAGLEEPDPTAAV